MRTPRLLLPLLAAIVLCLVAIVSVVPAVAQTDGDDKRVALVVGNFSYDHVPRLTNPGNDATLIANTLRSLGFTLIGDGPQENVDKAHFDHLVQDFGRAIQGADVALFYYAGHGMQVDGSNWLVPTDANPTRPQDLEFQMVNAELVLKQMDGAGTRLNLVILDACRNNPFATLGTRAVQSGLAQMQAPDGTMISFATQPGNVAADGSGADGPYAVALAAAMRQPGLDIFRLFNRVGLTVKKDTGGAQVPWVSSSPIDGEFYFTQTDSASDSLAAAVDATPAGPSDQVGNARDTSPSASVAPTAIAAPRTAAPPASPAAAATAPAATAPAATAAAATAPAAGKPGPTAGGTASGNAPASQGAAPGVADLQDLAAQGKADAQFDLGFAYAKGLGVARDDAAARHWFELAAGQGVVKAQYWMGAMLERGRGGPRSYAEALVWYRRAADQGFSPAEVAMGRFYGRGLGVPRDVQQRTDWYRRAAEHGNFIGAWALGNFYQFGDGMDKDLSAARGWYLRAADRGFVPAQIRLALMAEHGNGVPKDDTVALQWFQRAADAGSPVGLNDLGVFYRRGLGVPQDYAQAMRLFRQSADKHYAMAEFNIGLMYADGLGVPMDKREARAWFEKAAAAGNQPAIERMEKINAFCAAQARPGPHPFVDPARRPAC
jgi:TPR repeat protein